jgi:hypothetical protein
VQEVHAKRNEIRPYKSIFKVPNVIMKSLDANDKQARELHPLVIFLDL